MITKCGPISNVERQRQFRKRNPGYFNKYKRKLSHAAIRRKVREIYAAIGQAEVDEAQATPQPSLLPEPPAPILIPGINTIPAQSIPATPPPQTAMIADDPYLC